MGDNGEHVELFRSFAEAIQGHLDLKGQIDEGKVREIAVEEIVRARMPRPLAITVNDRPTESFLGLAREALGDDGQLSFRRAVQLLVPAVAQWKGRES